MSNIIPFFNQEFSFSVRAVDIEGEIYLVGKDVALALGYAEPGNAVRQHCRGGAKYTPLQTTGGMQETRVLAEGDVYRLIANSHLPTAEKFEAWVFDEVLPQIRKTGHYATAVATLPDFSNPAAAARAWAEQFEQREQLALENRAQANALAVAAPKVEFVDRYVDAMGNKGFRQVAKLLKANEARFRQFLEDKKIMYKLGGEWMPHQQHIDAGRFVVKTGVSDTDHAYNHAKFTPKGIEWIAAQWAVHCLRDDDEQEAA